MNKRNQPSLQGTHDELMKQNGIYRRFIDARVEAVSWKIS